ncbi:MAG: hypothetical protein ACI87E_000700 [Mariniblastus sp.]|jgi:hypothetical protein
MESLKDPVLLANSFLVGMFSEECEPFRTVHSVATRFDTQVWTHFIGTAFGTAFAILLASLFHDDLGGNRVHRDSFHETILRSELVQNDSN